jgi:hypothetical protein
MNKQCPICRIELTDNNIARWDIPNTDRHKSIRTDSAGKAWCQACTDEHDNIDWSD